MAQKTLAAAALVVFEVEVITMKMIMRLVPILVYLGAGAGLMGCVSSSEEQQKPIDEVALIEMEEIWDIEDGVDASAWSHSNRLPYQTEMRDDSPFQ